MNQTKFKILTHCGIYVDPDLLEKGIYSTSKPTLYPANTTIESLIRSGKIMKDMTGNQFISDKYFDNLKQCKLVDVTLTF